MSNPAVRQAVLLANQIDEDTRILNQLGKQLNGMGVSWVMQDRSPRRPSMFVQYPEAGRGLTLFNSQIPGTTEEAIYSYVGVLYMGRPDELDKVAKRIDFISRTNH